jgi:hypothetical protein
MIGALSLAAIVQDDTAAGCEWPGCLALRDSRTMCRKHQLRVERGWEVGTESAWDRLTAAALRFADAEDDHEYELAAEVLKRAAENFKRARKHPHTGRKA